MRSPNTALSVATVLALASAAVLMIASAPGRAQGVEQPRRIAGEQSASAPTEPNYLEWPLPAAERAYGAIDGRHLWQYVVEQAAISRRYRDQGHPQYWGRIIGTSADADSAQWLLGKFQQLGMTNTRIQSLDLAPQWIAQSWQVSVAAGGKTVPLLSAQPFFATPPTSGQGVDLEAVYVGLGREADFARHDVRGKAAVVFYSGERASYAAEPLAALKRAAEHGAAAIFAVNLLPDDIKIQPYPADTGVTTFSLALKDGQAVRDLVAQANGAPAPQLHLRLEVQMVPNLKTALVWGTLPGASDETIYVEGHRDGWFDAAGDNAGGVASMIGLAEYFAKIPQSQRRRTMVFVGMDGHHNSCTSSVPSKWCQPGSVGDGWLVAHHDELFSKTALMINDEHPSNVQTYMAGDHSSAGTLGETDTYIPVEWYAGGPSRPQLTKIVADAFQKFGVSAWAQPSPRPPAGDLGSVFRFVPGVASTSNRFFYFHTSANTPETVPWTGLESMTRAYAKIVDEVNKLDLKQLQRPVESDAASGRGAAAR